MLFRSARLGDRRWSLRERHRTGAPAAVTGELLQLLGRHGDVRWPATPASVDDGEPSEGPSSETETDGGQSGDGADSGDGDDGEDGEGGDTGNQDPQSDPAARERD